MGYCEQADYMFFSERYEQIVKESQEVAENQRYIRLGRNHSPDIRILLVSKYRDCREIHQALDYFSSSSFALKHVPPPNLGESYVQEAVRRNLELKNYYSNKSIDICPQLEMIGPLQSNKAAQAIFLFSALHSVSSAKLLYVLKNHLEKKIRMVREESTSKKAKPIEMSRAKPMERFDIFFQYNPTGEKQKNGCRSYDELCRLVDVLLSFEPLFRLRGLMCMGDWEAGAKANRQSFATCRELAESLWKDFPPEQTAGCFTPYFELSMGMSSDYQEALAEGANTLRIGKLLFSD